MSRNRPSLAPTAGLPLGDAVSRPEQEGRSRAPAGPGFGARGRRRRARRPGLGAHNAAAPAVLIGGRPATTSLHSGSDHAPASIAPNGGDVATQHAPTRADALPPLGAALRAPGCAERRPRRRAASRRARDQRGGVDRGPRARAWRVAGPRAWVSRRNGITEGDGASRRGGPRGRGRGFRDPVRRRGALHGTKPTSRAPAP